MCQTVRLDDLTIANEDRLFRRIPLYQIVEDEDTGFAHISSGAFRDPELSVNIESVLLQGGEPLDACLRGLPGFKLVGFTAGQARQLGQIVCRDPKLPDNRSHGLVLGSKKSKQVRGGLRDSARWVIPDKQPLYADIVRERRLLGLL